MNTHTHLPSRVRFTAASLLTLAALGLSVATPLAAQTGMEPPPRDSTREVAPAATRGDVEFLEESARFGLKQAEMSRVAVERSTNARVRAVAEELLRRHDDDHKELARLASTRGVRLAERADADLLSEWMKKEVDDFDHEYLEETIDDHEAQIDRLEEAVQSTDPSISAFARKQLPALHAHLAKVRELEQVKK